MSLSKTMLSGNRAEQGVSTRNHLPKLFIMLAMLLLLGGVLSSCGGLGGPPQAIVEKALNLQIAQTQQSLQHQLRSAAAPFSATQLNVEHTQRVEIDQQSAYRVEGYYTLKGRYRERAYQQRKTPFQLYLQPHDDEQWDLLQPSPSEPDQWQRQPVPSSA